MTQLTVVILRLPSRRLKAQVLQQAADGPRNGSNLLGRGVRKIETAKNRVRRKLGADFELRFEVTAAPDLVRAKKPKLIVAAPVV